MNEEVEMSSVQIVPQLPAPAAAPNTQPQQQQQSSAAISYDDDPATQTLACSAAISAEHVVIDIMQAQAVSDPELDPDPVPTVEGPPAAPPSSWTRTTGDNLRRRYETAEEMLRILKLRIFAGFEDAGGMLPLVEVRNYKTTVLNTWQLVIDLLHTAARLDRPHSPEDPAPPAVQRFMAELGCDQSAADDRTTAAFVQRQDDAETPNWQGDLPPPGGFYLLAETLKNLLVSTYCHARLEKESFHDLHSSTLLRLSIS